MRSDISLLFPDVVIRSEVRFLQVIMFSCGAMKMEKTDYFVKVYHTIDIIKLFAEVGGWIGLLLGHRYKYKHFKHTFNALFNHLYGNALCLVSNLISRFQLEPAGQHGPNLTPWVIRLIIA